MQNLKDMRFVLLGILVFGLTFAWIFFSNNEEAHAVDSTIGFRMTSVVTWPNDSTDYPPDSVRFYYGQATFGGDADSMRVLVPLFCELEGWTKPDTLCAYVIVNTSLFPLDEYNPSGIFLWYYGGATPKILRDNSPSLTTVTLKVDSLFQAVSASLTATDIGLIADSVDSILTDAHGTGAWTSGSGGSGDFPETLFVMDTSNGDAIVVSARVSVKNTDTASAAPGTGFLFTNASGFVIYSLDAATGYPVTMSVQGFIQETAYQLKDVAGPGGRDTIKVYAASASPPSPAGLTSVEFVFYWPDGDSIKNVQMHYKLESSSSENWHFDSTKTFDASKTFEADRSSVAGLVTISVVPNDSIYTTGYQTDKTTWRFWAYNPKTKSQLFGEQGIQLTIPASGAALIYPRDF